MTLPDAVVVLAMLAAATAVGDMGVACVLFATSCAHLHLLCLYMVWGLLTMSFRKGGHPNPEPCRHSKLQPCIALMP